MSYIVHSGTGYIIPTTKDFRIELVPDTVRFALNVTDPSLLPGEGPYATFSNKKQVGLWYYNDPGSIEPQEHSVRILPGFCLSPLFQTDSESMLVYPVPVFLKEKWAATLFFVRTMDVVSVIFRPTYASSDIFLIEEQLQKELSVNGLNVHWLKDLRNSICPFPDKPVFSETDVLQSVLDKLPKTFHLVTQEEVREAKSSAKKFIGGILSILAFGGILFFVASAMEKKAAMQANKNNTALQTLISNVQSQKNVMQRYYIVQEGLKRQPDFTKALSELYGGSLALKRRNIVITQQKTGQLVFVITGISPSRLVDVRPYLIKGLKEQGIQLSGTPAFAPDNALTAAVVAVGKMQVQ
jgi:hypothetical protein